MCFFAKIILTDSNLFFYLYAFLGNPQLLIITLIITVGLEVGILYHEDGAGEIGGFAGVPLVLKHIQSCQQTACLIGAFQIIGVGIIQIRIKV